MTVVVRSKLIIGPYTLVGAYDSATTVRKSRDFGPGTAVSCVFYRFVRILVPDVCPAASRIA